MPVLVDLTAVTATAADRVLLSNCSVTVGSGDRVGVVGINGTGKSTLLSIMAGNRAPDNGEVRRGRGTRVGFLGQDVDLGDATVRHVVGEGWQGEAALERLSMGSSLDTACSALSGGQRKRVALAAVLAHDSDLLILDEPTNHLDLRAVLWLEEWLANYSGGLVMVSHDRYLLDRVTTSMIELDRGKSYVHLGGYGAYLEGRAAREAQEEGAEATRRNLARRELAWLRRGAKARSRKPQARVNAAKTLIAQGPQDNARQGDLALSVQMPRLGDKVFELSDVGFSYGTGPSVLTDCDLLIGPGDRIGIVGLNGTGKSTVLDLLSQRLRPTHGVIEIGTTVRLGYADQHGDDLDPFARVQEIVAGPGRQPGSLDDIALMRRFWFTGNLPFTEVRDLSGGERRRLQLLAVLARQPNVLLLDEPTNDLDLDTLRALEDFLDDFAGTIIAVSHDRAFLDRTCETIIAIDTSAHLAPVAGGLDGWLSKLDAARQATGRTVGDGDNATIGRQLREVDKEMSRLTRQIDKLTATLLETTDHQELTRLGDQLRTARSALEATEALWLELAEAKDALG